MPAPLSLSRATITTPTDKFEGVSIVVRTGHATVRKARALIAEAEVVRVEQQGARSWLLTLDDDTTWTVLRARNCGCA